MIDTKADIAILPIESVLSLLRGEEPEIDYNYPIENSIIIMMSSFRPPKEIENHNNILFLDVDDITTPGGEYTFNSDLAKKVIDFIYVQQVINDYDDLHIISSCDGGISRSSGLCAALRIGFGQDDTSIWENGRYSPNELVYSVMREEIGAPVSEGELRLKMEKNKIARDKYFSDYFI